jgi:hypothetical protein
LCMTVGAQIEEVHKLQQAHLPSVVVHVELRRSLCWVLVRTRTSHQHPAPRRYSTMSEEEIKLDRYAKFRKLGDYADYPVVGGMWREAREERANVSLDNAKTASYGS